MHNKYIKRVVTSILFLSSSYLFANDITLLTHYRNSGIKNIQKELDQNLADISYWNSYLKNKDTSFGYFESYTNLLICDKSKSKLSLYSDNNNSYRLKESFNAFTGKVKGDKIKAGDLRTPVGVYNIIKKVKKVDPFYGPMAFVTSYPNNYDKYKGKTGQGIWIHGLPIEQKRDSFTKGCIAIGNQCIQSLNKDINITKTILIINEKAVKKNGVKKETFAQLLTNLFTWRYAWIYNDIDKYLSFYAPEFKRFDGMKLKRFKKYKTRIFNKKEHKTIIFKNINIIPYPNTNNIFKITFNEQYKSNSFSFQGNKVLIVKLQDNSFQIITEQ